MTILRKHVSCFGLFLLAFGQTAFCGNAHAQNRLDAQVIATASGTKTTEKEGVVRIEFPRKDVTVKVDGMTLKPAAGLGCALRAPGIWRVRQRSRHDWHGDGFARAHQLRRRSTIPLGSCKRLLPAQRDRIATAAGWECRSP